MDWALCAGVIVKRSVPSAEEFGDFGVVAVSQLFGLDSLFYGFYFYGRAVCVGTAYHQNLATFQPVVPGCNVSGQD
jgi:hypothetical protein